MLTEAQVLEMADAIFKRSMIFAMDEGTYTTLVILFHSHSGNKTQTEIIRTIRSV